MYSRTYFLERLSELGCFTCKDRKKKCDCVYTYDQVSRTTKCSACMRHNIRCNLHQPEGWVVDQAQKEAEQLERKMRVKLGKRSRGSREESDSSGAFARDRSMTLPMQEEFTPSPGVYRSIERPSNPLPHQGPWHMSGTMADPVRRGTFTATRGGKGGSKKPRLNLSG